MRVGDCIFRRPMSRIVLHGIAGVQPPVVARVSGDRDALREAAAGLPEGAATPEAIAIRIRRSGGEVEWGEPDSFDDGSVDA